MKQFHYCKACHRSHDQQRQHLYTKKHITSVEALLAKARKKVKEVRQYVRSPALIKEAEQARNQLWCVFCDEDVVAEASTFAW